MGRQDRRPVFVMPVQVDPQLERRWQEALLSRPSDDDPEALAAWNNEHGELVIAYQQAVECAREDQEKEADKAKSQAKQRRRSRFRMAGAITSVLLTVGVIVYWATRPSEDEIRLEENRQRDTTCTTHYEQTRHLKLVSKQIDLLKDGEGGWVDLYPHEGSLVGGVDLSPSELEGGKTGAAQVNHEGFVDESTLYIGGWALLERRNSRLVLTLFSNRSGFGGLPHAPLQSSTVSTVMVRGERLSPVCF